MTDADVPATFRTKCVVVSFPLLVNKTKALLVSSQEPNLGLLFVFLLQHLDRSTCAQIQQDGSGTSALFARPCRELTQCNTKLTVFARSFPTIHTNVASVFTLTVIVHTHAA